jgi:hypothetical protein
MHAPAASASASASDLAPAHKQCLLHSISHFHRSSWLSERLSEFSSYRHAGPLLRLISVQLEQRMGEFALQIRSLE